MKRSLLVMLPSLLMVLAFIGLAGSAGASSTHMIASDPPDRLNVAPGDRPLLAADGLSASFNLNYVCNQSSNFLEGSAQITVVLVQGPNAMRGTTFAQCDGLLHNFPGRGFVVSGPIALHRGTAQITGLLQQTEISMFLSGNSESNNLLAAPKDVTLV